MLLDLRRANRRILAGGLYENFAKPRFLKPERQVRPGAYAANLTATDTPAFVHKPTR